MPFNYANFEVDLTDIDACLAFARAELAVFGLSLPGDADLKLELNAGVDPDAIRVYRPYALMASVLSRAKNTKHLVSAEGATFADPAKTIAGWLAEQAGIDAARALVLPPGATIETGNVVYSGPVRMSFRL